MNQFGSRSREVHVNLGEWLTGVTQRESHLSQKRLWYLEKSTVTELYFLSLNKSGKRGVEEQKLIQAIHTKSALVQL